MSVVATVHGCSSILSTRGATVCKFPARRNYAVTQVSATGFEPRTDKIQTEDTASQCLLVRQIETIKDVHCAKGQISIKSPEYLWKMWIFCHFFSQFVVT